MSPTGCNTNDASAHCLHVATAADENYALPLAVTVVSLLQHLDTAASLCLYVLDGGITPRSRSRLLRSWRDPRLQVHWLQPDLRRLERLPVSHHITRTAYARLLLPSHLPRELSRVIYLDSDLLLQRDLTVLWNEPFAGAACLAIPDAAAPRIDAEIALPNFALCQPMLAAAKPIPNYRELKLDPHAAYFNSGVLCLDLEAWRRQNIAEQALACLDRHRKHVLWWDQYALNVVLHGRWRALDMRWNQGSHIYRYPSAAESPFDAKDYAALRDDPWIVHFTSPVKPWHFECDHPFRQRFLELIKQTAWTGWRPERPYVDLSDWFTYQYGRYRQWRTDRRRRRHKARAEAARRAA